MVYACYLPVLKYSTCSTVIVQCPPVAIQFPACINRDWVADASSIWSRSSHHELWTLQLSPLDRPEEGSKSSRKPKNEFPPVWYSAWGLTTWSKVHVGLKWSIYFAAVGNGRSKSNGGEWDRKDGGAVGIGRAKSNGGEWGRKDWYIAAVGIGRFLPVREVGAWALVGESRGGPHPKKERRASEPCGRLSQKAEWQWTVTVSTLQRGGI